jgi:hypothetical protein
MVYKYNNKKCIENKENMNTSKVPMKVTEKQKKDNFTCSKHNYNPHPSNDKNVYKSFFNTTQDENMLENEINKSISTTTNTNENLQKNDTDIIPEKIEKYPVNNNNILTDDIIDGDESIAYNSIHRNEPTRVINGMQNAYNNLNKYVREEVDKEETREWWGNNDY